METKYCSGCKLDLLIEDFNKKGEGLQPWCRDCNRERSRRYYTENKEKHVKVIAERKDRIRKETQQKYLEYLRQTGCRDCNTQDVRVLEPDHIRDKEYNVSSMINTGYSWVKILFELEKCEIVCANCHRIRTYERNGSYRNASIA